MFYLMMPSLEMRQAFIDHMKSHGAHCVFHYLPLHLSKMGLQYGGKPGQCPVCEDVSDRLVRLPFYNKLSNEEQNYIIEKIQLF
jgi:dTDP-4-amino-4,6-dideoxygalactose transaminase